MTAPAIRNKLVGDDAEKIERLRSEVNDLILVPGMNYIGLKELLAGKPD